MTTFNHMSVCLERQGWQTESLPTLWIKERETALDWKICWEESRQGFIDLERGAEITPTLNAGMGNKMNGKTSRGIMRTHTKSCDVIQQWNRFKYSPRTRNMMVSPCSSWRWRKHPSWMGHTCLSFSLQRTLYPLDLWGHPHVHAHIHTQTHTCAVHKFLRKKLFKMLSG